MAAYEGKKMWKTQNAERLAKSPVAVFSFWVSAASKASKYRKDNTDLQKDVFTLMRDMRQEELVGRN